MAKKCRKFFKNGELELREIFKNRDFKELMEFAELATAVCPDDFEGYFYLGVAYRGMGELENALESFKKQKNWQTTKMDWELSTVITNWESSVSI